MADFPTDQPRIQPLAFPSNVNLGERVTVTCVAAVGRKPFDFVWMHDGKTLANSKRKYSRVVVDNIVTMTIEQVTAQDVGNYTCAVRNDFGSDIATAALIVEGKLTTIPYFSNYSWGSFRVADALYAFGEVNRSGAMYSRCREQQRYFTNADLVRLIAQTFQ